MKEKNKKNNSCGCSDNCTCGDTCECTPENKCNENCTCHEDKQNCNCSDNCTCGDNCECTEDHKCSDNCNCSEHECDCGDECDCGCNEHHFEDRAEEFRAYQQAFKQFEEALEKVDRELTLEKARADKNEHLADSYKKDLERFKERNKDIVRDSMLSASIKMAEKILPILDNFGQAMKTVKDENVMIGFKMIENGIANILKDMEVVEIKAENEEFNPNFHDAVNIIKTDKKELDGKVASVYKKGYMLSDNSMVIRHAQVEIYKLQ